MSIKKVRKSTLKSRANERGKRGVPVQKQKQKQVQNVNQKVIVRIGDVSKKKSKRRRSRKPKEPSEGVSSLQQSLPPNVIYQSYKPEQIPSPQPATQNLPLEAAPTAKNIVPETLPVPTARGAFEDVGIGSEGFVTVLDVPTKKEQLAELITPVAAELPPWLQEKQPHPAFVQPSGIEPFFYKSPEKPSSLFNITPIKPSLDSPPWLSSEFQTPFNPSPFYAEPTAISQTTDVGKELTDLARFISEAANPIEQPSITANLPIKEMSSVQKMSEEIKRARRNKQQMEEARLMKKEDVNAPEQEFGLPANFFQAKVEPTFFENLQQIREKTLKKPIRNQIKKLLTEEQITKRRAYQKNYRENKKQQQETVPIY